MYWSTMRTSGNLVFSAARIRSRTRPSVVSSPAHGHANLEHAGQVLGSSEDLVARALVHRQRLAGDGGLVEWTLGPRPRCAVGGHVVSRPHADDVVHPEIFDLHFLLLAGGQEAAGLGRSELDQRLDRRPGAGGGAGLDDLTQEHEERDDARRSGNCRRSAGRRWRNEASTAMLTSSLMLRTPRLRSRIEVQTIGAPRMMAPIMALTLATTRLPGEPARPAGTN